MEEVNIRSVLKETKRIVFSENADVVPFTGSEDGSEYDVWLISDKNNKCVLKKAKEYEIEIYSCFFGDDVSGVPRFIEAIKFDGEDYFLTEYVPGEDLCKCDRAKLIKALDALISIQNKFWEDDSRANIAFSFEKSLLRRKNRGEYLCDELLEKVYSLFLKEYRFLPRTLCHDDLLPFNILVSDDKAYLIDWEIGGILPYLTPLARLIAHCEEKSDALFYMKDDDKAFAIDYYFDNFAKNKDFEYKDYKHSLDLFVFYEYCEWIMLGNKYKDADMEMFEKYLIKAKDHIKNACLI